MKTIKGYIAWHRRDRCFWRGQSKKNQIMVYLSKKQLNNPEYDIFPVFFKKFNSKNKKYDGPEFIYNIYFDKDCCVPVSFCIKK